MKNEKELAMKYLNSNGLDVPKRRDLWNKIIEQHDKLNELEQKNKNQDRVIWDESGNAVLCGDFYCISNDVRRILKENQQLKKWKGILGSKLAQELLNFLMSNYFTEEERVESIADLSNKFMEKNERIKELEKVILDYESKSIEELEDLNGIDERVKKLKELKNENIHKLSNCYKQRL